MNGFFIHMRNSVTLIFGAFFFYGIGEEWDFLVCMKRTAFVSKQVPPRLCPSLGTEMCKQLSFHSAQWFGFFLFGWLFLSFSYFYLVLVFFWFKLHCWTWHLICRGRGLIVLHLWKPEPKSVLKMRKWIFNGQVWRWWWYLSTHNLYLYMKTLKITGCLNE